MFPALLKILQSKTILYLSRWLPYAKTIVKSLCGILPLVVAGILVEGGLDLEAAHLGMVYSCVTRVLVTSSE